MAERPTAVAWQWALDSGIWRDYSEVHCAQLESLYQAHGEAAAAQIEIANAAYLVSHDHDSNNWVQQRMDNADVWRTVRRVAHGAEDEPGPKRPRSSSSPTFLNLISDDDEPAEEAADDGVMATPELVEHEEVDETDAEEVEEIASDATEDEESAAFVDGWLQRAPTALRDDSLRVQLEHVAESSRKACAETLQTLEESHEDAVFTSFWQSVLRERINPSAASSPPQQQRAHLPAQGACRGGMYGKR